MKKITFLLSGLLFVAYGTLAQQKQKQAFHTETHWELQGSFKYDFLCLLNTLSGDPYYLKYYEQEYQDIRQAFPFSPEVEASLQNIKRVVKDENKGIISAYLCLLYSATKASTLAELKAVTQSPEQLRVDFKESKYYSEKNWEMFERLRPDLLVILDFFIVHNFEQYYASHYAGKVGQKLDEIKQQLPKYNIIPAIEEHVGFPLESDTIIVYMLFFSQPHGIKIIGTRFLTDAHWPFEIVFRNAVHEMMHPPFHPGYKRSTQLVKELQQDSLWVQAFENRSTASGYNSYAGLFEEGAVQALENHINKQFGMGRDVAAYWAKQDGGVHVMAVCLYVAMQDWDFSRKNHYAKFLENFRKRVKQNGGLVALYRKMFPEQALSEQGN